MDKLFFANIIPGVILFKRFRLLRCLSAGQLAGVYLCLDQEQNRKIVLKIITTNPSSTSMDLAKFRNEVELSHSVRHINVLASDKFFSDEEFAAYTMEYMEGGTLAEVIREKRSLPKHEAIEILLQLCRGLNAIHTHGIVHRDLKPENILIDIGGNLKIADFGIAAHMSAPSNTTSDDIIGSINYLSPEYIESGLCDQRSDIYSLGVIAYQLFCGRLPFEGETMIETLTVRVLHDPPPPSRLRHDIPEALSRFVLRALDRKPFRRFQNVPAMISSLENIRSSSNAGPRPSSFADLFKDSLGPSLTIKRQLV